MNFDELVSTTFTKIKKKEVDEGITIETVQTLLNYSGVAELMQGESATKISRKLLIRRIRISGHRHNTAQYDGTKKLDRSIR